MRGLEVILLLLAICAALRLLAERIAIPYVTLLVVGGVLVALIPGLPRVQLSPELMFVIFVPPLLYAGAVTYPLRDLRSELGAIIRLSVLLVLVSTAAVAALVHALNPAFTWAAAVTLGAIVAPPDAAAVLSTIGSIKLTRRVQSILEGESMLNDATALLAYRVAIAAVVTASFSTSTVAGQFLIRAVGGVAIGLLVGGLVVRVQRRTQHVSVVAITVSLLTPYAAYIPAEQLDTSGVLAVVSAGLYLARVVPRFSASETRLQIMATWATATFLLESLIFILVGLELPHVVRILGEQPISLVTEEALAVSVCLIAVRFVWVIPNALWVRRFTRWLRHGTESLPTLREATFVAWAGLRGGESLVFALALPLVTATGAPFPVRDEIIFITFAVIFITLVVQGPTLVPLARWLRLDENRDEGREEAHARLSAVEAGLSELDRLVSRHSPHPEVVRYLRSKHRQRARRWAAREEQYERRRGNRAHDHTIAAPSHEAGVLDDMRAAEYRRIRGGMIRAEQNALLDLRDSGAIGDDVMRRVQRDLDMEDVLLSAREPVVMPVTEVASEIDAETPGNNAGRTGSSD